MFSEGGEKFIGLEKNENVCLAIYDKYDGFGNLKSLQVMGRAEMVEPFSDVYKSHAEYNRWNYIILASADMISVVNMTLQPFLKIKLIATLYK